MNNWLSAVLPLLTAVGVALLPGALIAMAARLRPIAVVGLAGPLSVALTGIVGVVAALLSLPFSAGGVLGTGLVLAAAALLIRRRWPVQQRAISGGRRELLLALLGSSIAFAAIVALIVTRIDSPANVSQTYDAVFHLNAVSFILDSGNASSFDLYRMTHASGGIQFYPSAWHSLVAMVVQISGSSVAVATNVTWLAVAGTVWPAGCVLLTDTLFGTPVNRVVLLPIAGALSASFAAFPYLLLDWGVLYPTGLAYALLPAGLALVAALLAGAAPAGSDEVRSLSRVGAALLLPAWFAAEVFAHPRSLFSAAVLSFPLVVGWLIGGARRNWHRPAARKRILWLLAGGTVVMAGAAVAAIAYVYRVYQVGGRPVSDRLNGPPAIARQGIGDSLLQAFGSAPITGNGQPAPLSAGLAIAVLAGLLLCWRRPGARWLIGAFVTVAVLYALAAGSNDDFAKLATALWYKDKYRLISLLPVLGVPLAAFATWRLWEAVRRLTQPWLAGLAAGLVLLVLLPGAWAGPTMQAVISSIGATFTLSAGPKQGTLLNRDEYDLLVALPDLTPKGSVIAGNPWNGSGLSWAIGGRQSLFPHLAGVWGPAALTIATGLDRAATDPAVCAALRETGVRYVLSADGQLWGGDPQAALYSGIDRAPGAGVLSEVARRGSAALYRISACGF